MSLIYLILPIALIVAGLALAAFLWALRTGQYDDLDTPPQRQLFGDERD